MADVSTPDANIDREMKKRPATLSILILLLLVRVLLLAVFAGIVVFGTLSFGEVRSASDLLTFSFVLVVLVVSIITLIALWGLWYLKPWAWQLNMIILGFMLIVGIWLHFADTEGRLLTDITLALNILAVFYLIQGEVRSLFLSDNSTSSSS